MARRLFIALLLIVAVSVGCWLVLPRYGVEVPVWMPLGGYVVIVLASVLPMLEREGAEEADEWRTPDPGPSPEDIERFNSGEEPRR